MKKLQEDWQQDDNMPDKLHLFLSTLTDDDAEKLWSYFDGTPNVAGNIIEVIVDSHPNLHDATENREDYDSA